MKRLQVVASVLLAFFGVVHSTHAASDARQENMGWKVSCRVDRGAIQGKGSEYVFRTSKNHCPGGIFKQRSEIYTKFISVKSRVKYIFQTAISVTAPRTTEEFVVFQIHDGRNGCAPPMSLRWTYTNGLRFDSDYTRGRGMKGCVENRTLRDARYSGPFLSRKGTEYHLQVVLDFDGQGNFNVNVLLDGKEALAGRYEPASDPGFVASKKFFMKHGVYSQNVFDYEMRSKGMRVLRVAN